jgi:hypothetical protein
MVKFIKKLSDQKISGKSIFIITGIASTLWFLLRVVPKPQRAYYPCLRVAAPIMSGFVIYLITLSGSVLAFRKAKQKFIEAKYLAAIALMALSIGLVTTYYIKSSRLAKAMELATGPSDGPNLPIGTAQGIYPGRVVWAWDPKATSGNPTDESTDSYHFLTKYNNQAVYDSMFAWSIVKLTGTGSVKDSWDQLFRYHNNKKGKGDVPYTKGEKIFIKINQVSSGYTTDASVGFTSFPKESWKIGAIAATQTTPFVVLSMLREMVNEYGVDQKDIYLGDPIGHIFSYNYDAWHAEFPNIHYIDRSSSDHGRTLIKTNTEKLLFYSDKKKVMTDAGEDNLFDIIKQADYLINMANLKAHMRAGISLNAKNHFGSHGRESARHLHPSLVAPEEGDGTNGPKPANINNAGYGKYRVLVDITGNKYLGGNTMLFVIDGYYGGSYHDNKKPAKWKSAPFNNDWCNSLFMSQDPVAIESVCYDFLRTEFDGINQGNHISPNWNGVDDYLHQAAHKSNWPKDISYQPNGDGVEIGSLGVHEHWNNPAKKQYTKNLFAGVSPETGIELVSIPDTLVRYEATSIEGPNATEAIISLYPNPVRDNLTISVSNLNGRDCSIRIIGIDGRLVTNALERQQVNNNSIEFTWRVPANIKAGYYICQITSGNATYNSKFYISN